MEYRRLGRTGLEVSVVGFGTNQLRLVPEREAIDTLVRGFELGVNFVHTSADYEGAEALVGKAIARSARRVIVASNAYDVHGNADGPVRHFEALFERTCSRLGADRLDLYGIAAVEDREALRENVWGKGGMVDFLQRMKAQDRLGSIFCTTHGEPAYVRKLVESDVFDAIMVSYNPLGYHLLSLHPAPDWHFESLPRNREEIFPLCRERDVGVMVMMPLAGGLLVEGRAFPPRQPLVPDAPRVPASDILRFILADPDVACVMPGTACVAEAEENAHAGEAPLQLDSRAQAALATRVALTTATICSRCGACEPLCSQKLPVSWLFRAGGMVAYPTAPFETWPAVEYRRLHPGDEATCATCAEVTCRCPYGIDVRAGLLEVHRSMSTWAQSGLAPPLPGDAGTERGDATFGARVVMRDIPARMRPAQSSVCRLLLENRGTRGWFCEDNAQGGGVLLAVLVDGMKVAQVRPREDVHAGGRGHFVFEVEAPRRAGRLALRVQMLGQHEAYSEAAGFLVHSGSIEVASGAHEPASRPWWHAFMRRERPTVAARAPVVPPAPGAFESTVPAAAPPYGVRWIEHNLPGAWREGEKCQLYVRAGNSGARRWRGRDERGECVDLVMRVNGAVHAMVRVAEDVEAGGEAAMRFTTVLPAGSGDWDIALSFVEQNVAWFEQHGVSPLAVRVRRLPASRPTHESMKAMAANPSFYTPSHGIARSRDGRVFPLVVREARGALIRDPEGHEWVDYVMGYGSALLGYAHEEIREAISRALASGAVLSLPHESEMRVTAALCESLPGAETVLFGKNGSDACTAALRIARVHTGRRKVLYSGYHGWHEPFAGVLEPALADAAADPQALRFPLNDLDAFRRLMEAHSAEVAVVMLEPAGQVEGVDRPVRDCDPAFLREVASITRAQGAVLVFDEVMTGFRYRHGSVQQATGVVPDLTCLGKALASGMPLSAVVGRRSIMAPALARICYHPTFKGEAYSFAAAEAALAYYRANDVPGALQRFAGRLRQGVDDLGRELGIAGGIVGLPFRMVYRFDESDPRVRAEKRTLLQQELLLQGVLTFRGMMLPSMAHGESELDRTLTAFRAALARVRDAEVAGKLASQVEIPLIV